MSPRIRDASPPSAGACRKTVGAAAALLIAALVSPLLLPSPARAATVVYTLYGETGGWGFSPLTITSPGPTLYATVGDTVDLTLIGNDGARHNWMLDYNGDSGWTPGEPRSADFRGNTTTYSFVANLAGTFRYQCEYHSNNQYGTFVINATSNPAPVATISYPNGGLTWTGGSVHPIWWNMSDGNDPNTALLVFLNYSYNAGASGGPIAGPLPGMPNPNRYDWTVPLIDATDARVNLTVVDPGGAKGFHETPIPVIDSTRPTVLSTQPADGAVEVPAGTWMNVTFSEPMNAAVTETAVDFRDAVSWALVPTTVVGWTGTTLTLRPASPLATDAPYQLNVSTAAADLSDPGNALAAPVTAYFVTFNTPPVITVVTPVGGDRWTGGTVHTIGWLASDAETMTSALSVNLSYSLTGGPPWTAIATDLPGDQAGYAWTTPLADASAVRVDATVHDGRGKSSFDLSAAFAIDSTAPTVTGTSPTGTGVVTTANVRVTFSERMDDPSTASNATVGVQRTGTPQWVAGWFLWDPGRTVLTFDPSVDLLPGTQYTAFVNTSARDASDPGNALASAVSWTFETGTGADTERPSFLGAQASPDPQEAGLAVNLTARVVDNIGVGIVAANVSDPLGGVANGTMAFAGGDIWYLDRVYTLVGTYGFRVWASDTSGNWNFTDGTFRIRDTSPPTVSGVAAVPDPAEVPAPVNVSALVEDNTGVAGVWFDVAAIGNLTGNFDVASGRHFAVPLVSVAGTYPFSVWACDVGGLCAGGAGQFVAVDTTPPTIAAVRVIPAQPEVNATARLEAEVSDNQGVASVAIDVAGVGNLTMAYDVPAGAYVAQRAFSPVGTYLYTVWATDVEGLPVSRAGSFPVADTVAPAIEHTPPGAAAPNATIQLTARITDNDWVASAVVRYVGVLRDAHADPLVRAGADSFLADVPAQPCQGVLQYNVTARDGSGNEAVSPDYSVTLAGATPDPCLYGHTVRGWGETPDTIASPGPTLTYDLGDAVRIVIIGADTVPHNLFVDYDGDRTVDAGEPISADVRGDSTVLAFTANTAGTFTYYCDYHQSSMFGTLVVRGPGGGGPGGEFPVGLIALLLMVAAASAVGILLFLWRRRKRAGGTPPGPESGGAP